MVTVEVPSPPVHSIVAGSLITAGDGYSVMLMGVKARAELRSVAARVTTVNRCIL